MVYFIDIIGAHSGLQNYDESFYILLQENGIDSKVISNYDSYFSISILKNHYLGSFVRKVFTLLCNYFRYLYFIILKMKKSVFIYNSFGLGLLDMIFLFPFCMNHNYFVLVHDIYIMGESGKIKIKSISNLFYKYLIKNAFVHSINTGKKLKNLGFKMQVFFIPHRYKMNMRIDLNDVMQEVINSIENDKRNILFFGTIRKSKGLDIFLKAIKQINTEYLSTLNFIIAGKDKSNIYKSINIDNYINIKRINRFISENELKYLFHNSDYIVLPYKEIYQSGLAELSICLRLPIIASDLNFFKETLSKYPSFGHMFKNRMYIDLARTIENIIFMKKQRSDYFSSIDLEKYYDTKQEQRFIFFLRQKLLRTRKLYE